MKDLKDGETADEGLGSPSLYPQKHRRSRIMHIQRLFKLPNWFIKIGSRIPILREQLVLWKYSHMILSFHHNQTVGSLMIWKEPETGEIHWFHMNRPSANKMFKMFRDNRISEIAGTS